MINLGFSHLYPSPTGHDSTVAIMEDGILKAAVSEERFSRIKHDGGYPSMAIQYCLNELGLKFQDIDTVSVGFGLEERYVEEKTGISTTAKRDNRFRNTFVQEKNPIFYNHQQIHARTAYSFTRFSKALIISLDGGGVDNCKNTSGGIFIVNKGNIESISLFPALASLGFCYGALTEVCGFRMQDGEGKTMSLAAYAENESAEDKERAYEKISKIFPVFKGLDYLEGGVNGLLVKFQDNIQLIANTDEKILSLSNSFKKELIAHAAQRKLEETVIEIIQSAIDVTGIKNIILTGGVFMNMIMNMKIRKSIDNGCELFFNPICGDLGNSVGAVLERHFQETGNDTAGKLQNLYLGPSYTEEENFAAIKKSDLDFQKVDKKQAAIELILKDKIIGWFQGRSELGARGLGNRSILSLSDNIKFKEIVNKKIKKRENWRPFCPTIIDQKAGKFLKDVKNAPYMIEGVRMKEPVTTPAICHIDKTCRPQILQRNDNQIFYDVVNGSGGIVLNTSFNLAGEPIVQTPNDAIRTFMNSELDAIIIGDFLISR